MEGIANELVAYMDFLGYRTTLDAGQNGGFLFRALDFSDMGLPAQSERGIGKDLREQLSDIQQKLHNPKSRVSALREKFEKFKKDAIITSYDPVNFKFGSVVKRRQDRKTLEQFNEYLKDYYDDDSSSDGSNSTTSTTDELERAIKRIDLSAPSPTVEEERQLAMKRPFIEEKVADFSDVFHADEEDRDKGKFGDALAGTGMGEHLMYGEKHARAKVSAKQVQNIRVRYWRDKQSQMGIAKELDIPYTTIQSYISRYNWKHLPQVEGEPDENMLLPNAQEIKINRIAKRHGVEPVRNKIGRLALPPELIKQLKKEAVVKRAENKKKKENKEKE